MVPITENRGFARRKWSALLLGALVTALGAGVAFYLFDQRKQPESDAGAEPAVDAQQVATVERRLDYELKDEPEASVVARFGQPEEKRDIESGDGKKRPFWRYANPSVVVSFCEGRVQRVRVSSLTGFPREQLGALLAPPAVPNGTERNLYPLARGTTWEYDVWDESNPAQAVPVIAIVVAVETKGGRTTALLSATSPGEEARQERVRSDARGVYRDGVAGLNSDREFPIIKYPLKCGDTWNETVRINNTDVAMTFTIGPGRPVTVPAGTFVAVPITVAGGTNDQKVKSTKWFAEGIGIVKETFDWGDRTHVRELKQFTLGK